MPKASEVANELRKLADAFDQHPESPATKAYVTLMCDTKEEFVSVSKMLPRPLVKSIQYEGKDYEELRVEYSNSAVRIMATIKRNLVCQLVEPAKPAVYKCEPILSQLEEESLV